MPYERKVVTTEDKSSTVYIPKLGECYHSSRGAVRESEHIFIENGLKYIYDKSDKEIITQMEKMKMMQLLELWM